MIAKPHVLVNPIVLSICLEHFDYRLMYEWQAELENQEMKEQELALRWERCGDA